LKSPDDHVLLDSIFYPFELYSRTCGQLALDVFWYGDTYTGAYRNRAFNGIRTLDVSATLDNERKQLVVYVVNQSKDKAMETTITLNSGEFAGSAQVSVINGPGTTAANTEENPNQIGIKGTIVKTSGKSFTCSFEPHSVTALVCAVS
jgi:alpha-N-arabinofuranosidase